MSADMMAFGTVVWMGLLSVSLALRLRRANAEIARLKTGLADLAEQFSAPSGPSSAPPPDSPDDFRNVLSLDQYRFDPDRFRSPPERASLDRWSREW